MKVHKNGRLTLICKCGFEIAARPLTLGGSRGAFQVGAGSNMVLKLG